MFSPLLGQLTSKVRELAASARQDGKADDYAVRRAPFWDTASPTIDADVAASLLLLKDGKYAAALQVLDKGGSTGKVL